MPITNFPKISGVNLIVADTPVVTNNPKISGVGIPVLTPAVAANHQLFAFVGNFIDNVAFVNGQTFTVVTGGLLDNITLWLQRTGNPTGNIRLNLHTVTSGSLDTINATILAQSTARTMGSITTGAITEYSFSFSGVSLATGQKYAFAYDPTQVTFVDASNRISTRRTDIPPAANNYAGGNYGLAGGGATDLDYTFTVNVLVP